MRGDDFYYDRRRYYRRKNGTMSFLAVLIVFMVLFKLRKIIKWALIIAALAGLIYLIIRSCKR